MKKKILLLGAFGYREQRLSGQTIKTRNIYELIKKYCSDYSIEYFDTQEIKYSKGSLFSMLKQILSCDILIYLPAHGNLKYLFPIVFLLSKLKNIFIIYVVVGGWLADFLKKLPLHAFLLKKIKKILVQTNLLKERLEKEYNYSNVEVLHNFRFNDFTPNNISDNEKLELVFMARINKLKGLDTIFSFAEYIKINSLNITIGFYGPVFENDKNYFEDQVSKYNFVTYHGVLEPEVIYETLSKYDVLLLPTQYYTEGFPGSILDAYISGIPVIVTQWLYATEFVEEGLTGYIVPFDNPQELFNERILQLYNNRDKLKEMKINASRKSADFSEGKAWDILQKTMEI